MKIFKARQMYLLFIVILSVFSITGCGGGGSDGQAPVLGTGDAVLVPTVTAVTPLNLATGVPINTKIIAAAFSKDMASATLTTSSFTLVPEGGAVITGGTVNYITASRIATLTLPAGNLQSNKRYTATITSAATDTAGTHLASNFVWTFTTGAISDSTAPFVISTGAYGITGDITGKTLPINRVATATFNEAMNPLTITTPPSFTVVNDTLGGIAVPGTVTYSLAAKTATFTPTGGTFAQDSKFTATITTAAKDLAGVPMLASYTWDWLTGADQDSIPPTVLTTNPLNGATGVCENKTVNATFSEDINPDTLTTLTFTVAGKVGVISYNSSTFIASFNPVDDFLPGTYTATIKGGPAGVKDLAGNYLLEDRIWTFTTDLGTCAAPPSLGLATPFAIASAAGVNNTGATQIYGNVVLDPTATCNSGALAQDGTFTGCLGVAPLLTGLVITPLYPDTVTSGLVKADLNATYLKLEPGQLPGATVLGCATIGTGGGAGVLIGCAGNATLPPGIYQAASASSIGVTGDLTLDGQGDENAQFVFQMASTLTTAAGAPGTPGSRIILINGAKASNVWWQVGSSATIGTYSEFNGNVLADTSITMNTGASSCGRLLAGAITASGAFTFDTNIVSVPGQNTSDPSCQ